MPDLQVWSDVAPDFISDVLMIDLIQVRWFQKKQNM